MTPLELYYQQKAAQKPVEKTVQKQAAKQLLGNEYDFLIEKNHPGLFMQLLDALDRPGNAVRSLLVGKLGGLKGLIPFAGVLEDLTGLPFKMGGQDRVPGTELIETWFGKQKQVPGKIDPVDALGFVAEVALDPLWLVGGGGLTKLGKAKQLVSKGIAAAKEADQLSLVRDAIKAAKSGKPIETLQSKALSNAIKTVYDAGTTPNLAKSWAEQAARGERALITIAGKPVVAGGKTFWDMAEKSTEVVRKSAIGRKFLAPYRQVAPRYDQFADDTIHNIRDVPVANTAKKMDEANVSGIQFNGISPKAADDALNLEELAGIQEKVPGAVKQIRDDQFAKIAPTVDKLNKKYSGLANKHREIEGKLSAARDEFGTGAKNVSEYPAPYQEAVYNKIPPDVSVVRGRGIERRMSKLENALNRLEYSGRPEDVGKIQRLQKIIQRLEQKGMQSKDAMGYLRHVRPLEQELRSIEREMATTQKTLVRLNTFTPSRDQKAIRRLLDRQQWSGGEIDKILQTIPEESRPKLLEMVNRTTQEYKDIVSREKANLLKTSILESPIGYTRRWLTPEAAEFLEKNQDTVLGQTREYKAGHGAMKQRKEYMADLTRSEINDIFKQQGFEGDVFVPESHKALFVRQAESERAMGVANAVRQADKRFRVKIPEGGELGKDFVPMEEYYQKIGMNVPEDAAGHAMPRELLDAFVALKDSPGGISKFWKVWTDINRMMKGLFTLPMPAYYAKNIIGDIVNGFLDGVTNPKVYYDSARLNMAVLKAGQIAKKKNITFDEAAQQIKWPTFQTPFGEMDGKKFWDLSQQNGVTGQTLGIMHVSEIPSGQYIVPKKRNMASRFFHQEGAGWDRMRSFAEMTENWSRIAHFADKMEKGMDPMSAASRVKQFHFDYGDLSDFEKRTLRDRGLFFYTYSRKNLPLQLAALVKTPGRQAIFSHLAGGTPTIQGEGKTYPDWWQEQLIAKTPFRSNGNPVRMMSLGVPIEEAFSRFSAPGVGWTRIRRLIQRNLAQLQPTITKPIELATGKSLYFDQPITNFGKWAIEASPMGRFASTYRQMQNSAETVNSKVGGFISGLRTREFNAEKQKQWKIREVARKFLSQYPDIKVRPDYYVSKEKKPLIPSDVQMALQVQ